MDENEKSAWLRGQFVKHERSLLRYVLRYVDLQRGKEIVQDSFIQLLKVDPPEKVVGREGPWLLRVCRNRALDNIKKQKPVGPQGSLADIPVPETPADEKVIQNESAQDIRNMVSALRPNQQDVIRLKFQEGLSYKEISQVTGMSVGHVGVLLHEGIKALREEMQSKETNQKKKPPRGA